jgi:hypothetical protein
MCFKPKVPQFKPVDSVIPDNKPLAGADAAAQARSQELDRLRRAGYRQNVFTSGRGAPLASLDKKKAFGA